MPFDISNTILYNDHARPRAEGHISRTVRDDASSFFLLSQTRRRIASLTCLLGWNASARCMSGAGEIG